jgi:predicted PurR-regulated permease PerM
MPEDSPQAQAEPRRVEIVISGATVLKAALIALGVYIVIIANEVFLTILLSLVFALGLDPLVGWFTQRGMGRGKAALLVFFLIFVAVSVLVLWVVTPLWNEVKGLVNEIPGYIDDLKDEPAFKELHENTDAVDKAQGVAQDAAKAIPEAASALLGITGALVGTALSAVTMVFLTLFLLIGLPEFKRAALGMLPPPQAQRTGRMIDEVTRTISFSLLGNIAISVIAGTVVGITAVIIGAPFPVVLAVIVGLFDLIPQVGSLIAAIIVVSITLAGAGVVPAVILAVVILVYQQVENYVVQPVVYRHAIELSGFATIAVVMVGGALMGVIGAILAVPVAGSLKVIFREITAAHREKMERLRAASPETQADPSPP